MGVEVEAPPVTTYEWLTVKDAAKRAKVSDKMIYHAIKTGKLRASRLGVRRDYRILESWLYAWIESQSTPLVVNPDAPGEDPPPGAVPFTKRGPKADR
jgi:excisionase family DNA binding protein